MTAAFSLTNGARKSPRWAGRRGDLFDVRAGLVWWLGGARVEALGADHVRLGDGRTLETHRRGAR